MQEEKNRGLFVWHFKGHGYVRNWKYSSKSDDLKRYFSFTNEIELAKKWKLKSNLEGVIRWYNANHVIKVKSEYQIIDYEKYVFRKGFFE